MKDTNTDQLYVHGFYDYKLDTFKAFIKEGKKRKYIPFRNPRTPAYITKETPTYIKEFVYKEDCIEIHVPYKNREIHLAKALEIPNFEKDVQNKKYDRKTVYLDRRLYGADMRIEDYYVQKFLDKIDGYPSMTKYDNGYLDIETDVLVDPDDWNNQPIFLISNYVDTTNTMYIFATKNNKYKKQDELLNDLKAFTNRVKNNLIKELDNNALMNNPKKKNLKEQFMKIFKELKIVYKFYDEEKYMIIDAWQNAMVKTKVDFLHAYNASYDVSQTERRAIKLGIPLSDIMCDKNIGSTYYSQHEYGDCKSIAEANKRRKTKDFHPKDIRFNVSCDAYTKIVDDMILHYAARAKKFDSYSLDDTCKRNIGFGKVDFSDIADNVTKLHYVDYMLALEYNIRDTLLLALLNISEGDMITANVKKYIDGVDIDKIYTPKVAVSALYDYRAKKMNMIYRNDVNSYIKRNPKSFYEKMDDKLLYNMYLASETEEKIDGGLCTDPNLFVKVSVTSDISNTKQHKTTADNDMTSYYPTTIIASNISLESLFGKIIDCIYSNEEIMTRLANKDIIDTGELFGLPSMSELYAQVNGINNIVYEKKKIISKTEYDIKNDKLRKVLCKMLRYKTQEKDEEAGYLNINNMFMLSIDDIIKLSYNGTLVEYYLTDKDNNIINISEELIETTVDSVVKFSGGKLLTESFEFYNYLTPKRKMPKYSVLKTYKIPEDVITTCLSLTETNLPYTVGDIVLRLNKRLITMMALTNDINVEILETNTAEKFIRYSSDIQIDDKVLHLSQIMNII